MTSEKLLNLKNVYVSFEGFLALNNLNLSLNHGELRAVIGPNGAGKTTFLDVITGKVKPTSGDVFFKGKSIVGKKEHKISKGSKKHLIGKRSIYISRDILKGEMITKNNIKVVRPNKSLHPKYYNKIQGMRAKKNFFLGDRIKLINLKKWFSIV